MASGCLHSTRSLIPNPVLTSKSSHKTFRWLYSESWGDIEVTSGSRDWMSLIVVCSLQKHYSPALPDHHPGEEIPQSPDVPGGSAEHF